ncbi:MAG: hypothetical protein AAB966_05070 [Patescibacteria group bacterium]
MKQLIFLGLILSSSLCIASEFNVQKFPLTFRSGDRAGVFGKFRIQDKDYSLLIDSGASGHGLNYKLVKKMKLALGKTGEGSTPHGDIHIIHIGTIHTQINGKPLDLRDAITVKNDPGDLSLEKDGIWGTVSPSALADDKLAVLDLAKPAMYLIYPVPKNIMGWLMGKYSDFDFDELPRVSGRPYVEMIETTVDDLGNLKMTVDSGATTTNIYSDSIGDSSKPISIWIQKHRCSTPMARIRSIGSPGHQNHLLGMDCLQGKILVFPPTNLQMLWIGWPKK